MRVTIVASGTRGDVQPLIPLAHGLQAAGHDVAIAAAADSQPLVTRHGLVFRSLGSGTHDQLTTDAGRAWIADSAGRPFRELRHMRRVYEEAAQPMAEGLLRLAGTADVFVSGILTLDSVSSIARHDNAGHVMALLCPFHPTADGRSGLTAQNPHTRRSNLSRTRVGRWLLSRSVTQAGRLVRKHLGVPETGPKGFVDTLDTVPAMLGASPLLVPQPEDWPRTVTVTGPWLLPAQPTWRPPAQLTDFLDAGPPPVCLGFGSLSVVQPERIREVATAAARAAGQRLILLGTDLAGPDGDDVFGASDVPHGWLYPRVRGAVHHGGAGTTHAALLAGAPQFAVPHVADQPYWGRRVHEEGLGPAPLPLNQLSVQRLSGKLSQFETVPHYRTRATQLSELAAQESGVQIATDLLVKLYT